MRAGTFRPAMLLLAALTCLPAVSALGAGIEAVCDATISAWRQDPDMRQYLNDYDCRCSNGNSSPPVCSARGGGSAGPVSGGGGGGGKKRGPSDEMLVLGELQKQVDRMFQVNWQAYRKYQQMSLKNAQQIHQDQLAATRAEEERKQRAAREEAARKEIEALEVHTELLGMPPAGGGVPILDITSALDEDARKKQLAECPGIAGKIARYENGIRRIDDVMARNDRMIREAEAAGKKAEEDLRDTAAGVAVDKLKDGLANFAKTQETLKGMKKGLDGIKTAMGQGKYVGELTPAQVAHWEKWVDNGLTYGQNVMDLTEKGITYYNAPVTGDGVSFRQPFRQQLTGALSDFNEKFMYEQGGWEFVGEHLSKAVGGVAGEAAFKTAIVGINATAAGIGMKMSRDQLRGFNENQDKMSLERFRLEQRIAALKESFVNNRCPVTKAEASPAPVGGK
jgi:hypothetical protein